MKKITTLPASGAEYLEAKKEITMKGILRLAGLSALILVVGGTMVYADQPIGRQLSAPEISKTFIGNTARFLSKSGNDSYVFRKEDGAMYGRAGNFKASGSWKLSDDGKMCNSWSSSAWESGCGTLFLDEKTGVIRVYNMEGTLRTTVTEVLPGNPEKL